MPVSAHHDFIGAEYAFKYSGPSRSIPYCSFIDNAGLQAALAVSARYVQAACLAVSSEIFTELSCCIHSILYSTVHPH